jgi:hypothetical protein
MRLITKFKASHAACAGLLLSATAAFGQPAPCLNPPPNPPSVSISPQLPADVCIPDGTGNPVPFAFFDDFSWRSFVALVWPALQGQRGVADAAQGIGTGSSPLVFETYKADWEVFQQQGAAPASWNTFGGKNPCPNVPSSGFNDLVLASFTKFGNVGQAGVHGLVGPLVAQNGTYVLYLAAVNSVEFNQILANQWYLRSKLSSVRFTPDGLGNNPIDIKSSWVVIKNNHPNPARYYTRTAWVFDLTTNSCSKQTVGLVGLHIVTKTGSRAQWVWSTFEQIDNVPGTGATAPFGFNNGQAAPPMPIVNPTSFPPPPIPPQPPMNVIRQTPIAASTQTTNAKYQAALKTRGLGVWQFYQLVATQWPVPGNAPQNPATPAFTFPGTGATTAFANTTMETFDQRNIRQSCMACHNIVGPTNASASTDFLWMLELNAFPATTVTNASEPRFRVLMQKPTDVALQQLKTVLQIQTAP